LPVQTMTVNVELAKVRGLYDSNALKPVFLV